jgi:hypothetical protein
MEKQSAITRRTALKGAGALALAAGAIDLAGPLASVPQRAEAATTPSDIQFDIGAFLTTPPQTSDTGVQFQMPPVHTVFLTASLGRTPTVGDQTEMNRVLSVLEQNYPWGATYLVTFLAYGIPYFSRLPGGFNGSLVSAHMPRLLSNTSRYALEEAVPSPTDFGQPGITKLRYNVPVRIESNEMLFTLRSDNSQFISEVLAWFAGNNHLGGHTIPSPAWSGLINFTSSRYMFAQIGLPQSVAQQNHLPFANFIQHQSPMWMGFADQHTNGAGPAPICTFVGNSSAKFTNAAVGDYLDNGGIQHLSHDILDMLQFFDMDTPTSAPGSDGVFLERVQYMFHAPNISPGNADPYTDGGGSAFLPNTNNGTGYAARTAAGIGTNVDPATGQTQHRMGHLSCLQRSSRAADGTPVHIRMDGPGFDNMDVPDGSSQPKLQFTVFTPTAEFFRTMRVNQASLDLQNQFAVPPTDNGLERFITATRRQNFLVPPRRHRAFPLVELA